MRVLRARSLCGAYCLQRECLAFANKIKHLLKILVDTAYLAIV